MVSKKLKLLRKAIEKRRLKKVQRILLKNPDIQKHAFAKHFNSPLWTAMFLGYEEIVEILVEFGADIDEWYNFDTEDFSEEYYLTFLHWLAISNDGLDRINVAEVLIKHGANVNTNYYCNLTPLDLAIKGGNVKYAELLIKNNGKISADQEKYVPLQCDVLNAPISKQREMLHLLIDYSIIDINYCNHEKENLLHILFNNVDKVRCDLIKICQILIRLGVPMNARNVTGKSPFFMAVSTGNIELISIFVEEGADVNDEDSSNQRSVLHVACIMHNEEIIRLLLHKGAQISAKDYYGSTPFSLLDSAQLNYDQCLSVMIKEFSKLAFENFLITKSDLDIILSKPKSRELFYNCKAELSQIGKKKFYASLSYYWVLKMSKKIKELSVFLKSKEFARELKINFFCLNVFYYKNDLLEIIKKAMDLANDVNL